MKIPSCPTCRSRSWAREVPGKTNAEGGIILDEWQCDNGHVAPPRMQRTLSRLTFARLRSR